MKRNAVRNYLTPILLALVLPALSGCMSRHSTTTPRTAIEEALLSQSAEATVSAFEFGDLDGKKYVLKTDYFEAPDAEYLLGTLQARLLEEGMIEVGDEAEADLLVFPSAAHAAIDESRSNVGTPELPIGLPGVGSVVVPEMSIYGRHTQKGRNRMFVFAKDARTGRLAFQTERVSSQRHYDRWTFFFLINFRLTDLVEPH